MNLADLIEASRILADNLRADIQLAATREEHIRVTARANLAENIARALEDEGIDVSQP